jgi:hypothetical protein
VFQADPPAASSPSLRGGLLGALASVLTEPIE